MTNDEKNALLMEMEGLAASKAFRAYCTALKLLAEQHSVGAYEAGQDQRMYKELGVSRGLTLAAHPSEVIKAIKSNK